MYVIRDDYAVFKICIGLVQHINIILSQFFFLILSIQWIKNYRNTIGQFITFNVCYFKWCPHGRMSAFCENFQINETATYSLLCKPDDRQRYSYCIQIFWNRNKNIDSFNVCWMLLVLGATTNRTERTNETNRIAHSQNTKASECADSLFS